MKPTAKDRPPHGGYPAAEPGGFQPPLPQGNDLRNYGRITPMTPWFGGEPDAATRRFLTEGETPLETYLREVAYTGVGHG